MHFPKLKHKLIIINESIINKIKFTENNRFFILCTDHKNVYHSCISPSCGWTVLFTIHDLATDSNSLKIKLIYCYYN